MASSNKQSVSVVANRLVAMAAGFTKDFTAKESLAVEGVTMLQPAILAQLASELALIIDAETARNMLATKVAAKKAGSPATLKFLSSLEAALKVTFGSGNPQLQDFGIAPPKAKKQLTAEEKAIAIATAKGTKKARGIIGTSQRGAITTQGKPGLALIDAQGNVIPGAVTGPTPPGSGTPVTINGANGSSAPSTPGSKPTGNGQ